MTPSDGVFLPGERVQLTGPKGKHHTIVLVAGGQFHTRKGVVHHDDVLGRPDGITVTTSMGVDYLALRPLLHDFVMSMPRVTALVYPKDAAQILAVADIHPGARVVEAGAGSGALSLWLLRAVGAEGHLFTFERRAEFADVARANVASYYGEAPRAWSLTLGDLAQEGPDVLGEGSADRAVLDMLAPWECLPVITRLLRPGGVLTCYVATVTQLSRLAEAIRQVGRFTEPESTETIQRGWHVDGLAVRPDHRMIGHTGFLLTTRILAPGTVPPRPGRLASKTAYGPEDVEAWTPGALGQQQVSARSIRKRARAAADAADKARHPSSLPDSPEPPGAG
ncbi:MAG TPA: tRNA (adenine-N1)-methyltransferase [Microbacteriaceae bacterium]|nr:tRNA (adenine-N1)-methyltransferase [Microbacteriaceae bacterium]